MWAGTGEAFIRSNVLIGDGIYKSTDGGETWKNMGLGETGRIGRIIVHPRDPEVVFACAVGHGYGPQKERGVFRTLQGTIGRIKPVGQVLSLTLALLSVLLTLLRVAEAR